MTESVSTAITEWAQLLGAGSYFEAHEVLEGFWLTATEPERTFLKGLIHIAVALYHHQRGNRHGARVKYQSARRYLAPYQPRYQGVELADLFEQLDPFFAELVAHSSSAEMPSPPAAVYVPGLQDSGKLPPK